MKVASLVHEGVYHMASDTQDDNGGLKLRGLVLKKSLYFQLVVSLKSESGLKAKADLRACPLA